MDLKKFLFINLCLLSCSLGANSSEETNASESFNPHTRKHTITKSLSFNTLEDLQVDSPKSPTPTQSSSVIHRNLFTISNIQGNILKKGVSVDDLEGGFVLLFDTTGKLQNPTICQLKHVIAAMELGSPEAFLVKGVIDQIHRSYEFAFRHFSTAASGNDGNGQGKCGGTSTELCFYNFYKLLSQGGFKGENGELIKTSQHYKYNAEDYKKFRTLKNILELQLQGLIKAVKDQSRSHRESSISSKPGKQSKLIKKEIQENQGHKISKSPSFWGGYLFQKPKNPQPQSDSMQIKALVSPRPENKRK